MNNYPKWWNVFAVFGLLVIGVLMLKLVIAILKSKGLL